MHIIDRGRGETVVLLHGANPVSYFDDLVEALAPHYRVLVPELPGWGKSPALVEGQAFEVTNDALRETLRQAGVDRAAIVGYSLGGWRALELALSGVFDVTCVYLLSSFTASPAPELRERYRGYAELARSKADLRPAVRDLYLPPEYAAAHPDIHDQVTDWVHACPRDVFAGELAAVADITDLAPQLSSLTKPVVARVGALDIAAPADWSRAIVDAVPQGRLELVEGCGHALLYEDRDATITSILKYLSQCTGRHAG
ncbi:MAG: alpha/beta fold hydrolase [Spirochaeta sp.]|jgi:3-oxoadipate enol-lactonase|nr:alpha/beta fold hydrolase [Spirochaeta sp.]